MADGAQHHGNRLRPRQIVDARPRAVDDLQCMYPDVAFGMPLRLLFAARERLQFGKELGHDAKLHRERKSG